MIRRDGIFYPHRTLKFDSFSCIPLDFQCFILKVAFITTYNDVDVGHVFKMTSLWRQNHANLTTKLHDALYNQCKPNSRIFFYFFFFWWNNMGEIRISIPSENLGFPYPVCQKKFVRTGENRGKPSLVCKKNRILSSVFTEDSKLPTGGPTIQLGNEALSSFLLERWTRRLRFTVTNERLFFSYTSTKIVASLELLMSQCEFYWVYRY